MPEQERCYYNNKDCEGELWKCLSCGTKFCQAHFHTTDKGHNVECCSCESDSPDIPPEDTLCEDEET